MSRNIRLGEKTVSVELVRRDDLGELIIAGRSYHCAMQRLVAGEYYLTLDGVSHRLWIAHHKDMTYVHGFGRTWELEVTNPAEAQATESDGLNVASAPMPGVVVSVMVEVGEAVERGQTLMIIESMKMESEITARTAGRVEAVMVAVGDTFERGSRLVALASEE
jgi:3-methylcrotonyl-CoA carboxylase alpha subunit